MNYKIEKAGYKFRGYELGQKVMYKGKETEIVGFDTNDGDAFIAIKFKGLIAFDLRTSTYATIVLDTAYDENHKAGWFKEDEIIKIEEKETPMEKKMTKADLEGKWVKVTKGDGGNFKTGDVLSIKNRQIRSKNNLEGLYSWFNELPEEFTLSELNKVLSTSYQATSLVYFDKTQQTQNKVKTDEVKSDKKSKVSEIKTKLHVDLLFDKPVVEETKEEVYIFSGRATVYFHKDLGIYGVATVNSKELNTYCKDTGKAIAFYRAYNE